MSVLGEVAGSTASINAGIFLADVACVVGRAIATHEACATIKHVLRCSIVKTRSLPTFTHVDGLQVRATREHFPHGVVGAFFERAQVEHLQGSAARKHFVCLKDFREVGKVDELQFGAVLEHVCHSCSLRLACHRAHIEEFQ